MYKIILHDKVIPEREPMCIYETKFAKKADIFYRAVNTILLKRDYDIENKKE